MTGVARRDLTLAGIATGWPVAGPETVHVDLVNACNAACITCWDHSPLLDAPRLPEWKRRRASAAGVARLLDDLEALGGLTSVIFSGMGEPFVHPEIDAVLADAKGRGLHVTVITNLLLADPARVVALGVDQLLIGIHGASRASYEAFHPGWTNGEWDRLLGALRLFRDAGRRFKHVHVICETNAHELAGMVELASEMRAGGVTFKRASLSGGTERCGLSGESRARLLAEGVPRARETAERLGVTTNLDVLARQLAVPGDETAPIAEIGCFMGYAYARVTVDGEVLFCCDPAIRVGRLEEGRGFAALWRGDAWQALRDRLRGGAYLPGCARCGKLNQNVALGSAFERVYGREALLSATGRG